MNEDILSKTKLKFEKVFNNLSSEHKQLKFFKENKHFVEPQPAKNSKNNKIGYFVPFKNKLESLLSLSGELDSLEIKNNIYKTDVNNGFLLNEIITKKKKMISESLEKNLNSTPLMIALYYDDIEIVNPIGNSRKKHKLGVFYWTLLNLKPFQKFNLCSLQLLAVSKVSLLKKDNNIWFLLQDFINNINVLNTNGLNLMINSVEKKYVGFLAFCLGDTPALNF